METNSLVWQKVKYTVGVHNFVYRVYGKAPQSCLEDGRGSGILLARLDPFW